MNYSDRGGPRGALPTLGGSHRDRGPLLGDRGPQEGETGGTIDGKFSERADVLGAPSERPLSKATNKGVPRKA